MKIRAKKGGLYGFKPDPKAYKPDPRVVKLRLEIKQRGDCTSCQLRPGRIDGPSWIRGSGARIFCIMPCLKDKINEPSCDPS